MVVFIVLEKGKSNVYDEFYLFVFIVASLWNAGILLLIITALRITVCTVLRSVSPLRGDL